MHDHKAGMSGIYIAKLTHSLGKVIIILDNIVIIIIIGIIVIIIITIKDPRHRPLHPPGDKARLQWQVDLQ